MSSDGQTATPLSGDDAIRWNAVKYELHAIADGMADGTLDAETAEAGLRAVAQIPLDVQVVLNSIHVPADAGKHAEGIERMLRRIPDGWGRWIGCDAGWYPLITKLDAEVAALIPDYEIHQVKEKYGTLRYYWGLPEVKPECCTQLEVTDPRPSPGAISGPWAPKDRPAAEQQQLEEWFERWGAHVSSGEHAASIDSLRRSQEMQHRAAAAATVEKLVDAAEEESAHTCESCGASGALRNRGGWVKTLCAPCATNLDYDSN